MKYNNNDDLLNILKTKKVIIKDYNRALDCIERYSYYSIIGKYKVAFKDQNNRYLEGTTFEEIYALYDFDQNIECIFLKYILKIERLIKTKITDLVLEKYGIKNYLNIQCFDPDANINKVNDFIDYISKVINSNYYSNPDIKFFIDHYNCVPSFVLKNILTSGSISKYYELMKQNDRQKISRQYHLSDKTLKIILINFTNIRNICAHGNVLYDYKSKYRIKISELGISYRNKDALTDLYIIVRCMKLFLDEQDYREFIELFYKELEILEKQLHTINITEILKILGFNIEPRSSYHTGLLK